jgi:uncharacterized protein
MKATALSRDGSTTWALVFDAGDEVTAELERFAREQQLDAAHFTAIGGFSDVTLGYFDWQAKRYEAHPIEEQVEVLMLAGDVADDGGEPAVHAHVVVGKSDCTAHGGHLLEAHVRPTLELVLTETPAHLRKRLDPVAGIALIAPDDSSGA